MSQSFTPSRRVVRITTPSLFWAIAIVLGLNRRNGGQNKKTEEPGGCERIFNIVTIPIKILLLPLLILLRPFYAYLYLTREGYFFDTKEGKLIGVDFIEPANFLDLVRMFYTGSWLQRESQDISLIKNYEGGQPGLFWTKFAAVGPGNAKMPEVAVWHPNAIRPDAIEAVIKAWQEWWKDTAVDRGRKKRAEQAAKDEIAKRQAMKRLEEERGINNGNS